MRRGNRQHPRPEAGAILLEMVIGMAIFSIIAIGLLGMTSYGAHLLNIASRTTQRVENVGIGMGWLRAAIQRAYPLLVQDADGTFHGSFVGREHKLRFATFLAPPIGEGGLGQIEIAASRDRLTLRILDDHLPAEADPEKGDRRSTILVEGIRNPRFAYFGPVTTGTGEAWTGAWAHPDKLPKLIRISFLTSAGGQDASRHEIVVHPFVDTDADCVYDLLTHDCRGR